MPNVALLHAENEFADHLATAVNSTDARYDVDVYSQSEVRRKRIRRLYSGEYDLLQADETMANGMFGVTRSLSSSIPLVLCFRGWADYTNAHNQYGPLKHWSIRLRTAFALSVCSDCVYLSEATRRHIQRYYSAPEGAIVGRPFDVQHYSTGNDSGTSRDGFHILTTTNLRYREKLEGVLTILDGLKGVFESHPDTRYAIAGGGRHLNELRDRVASHPHSDKVDILGFRSDIPDVLAMADLFIYVSFLDAYPMAVLEAQASGLPVIAGDSVGVPEAVGEAGLLCEPVSEAIKEAVQTVRSTPETLDSLASQSREKMATYNQDVAQQYVAVWDRILDQ